MLSFVYIVLAIFIIILILSLVAPRAYQVERSISINKPVNEVFDYLKYLKNQDEWSPWFEKDPHMKKTYTGDDGTVGFISAWDSEHKHVGAGEQEILGVEENTELRTQLRFLRPFKSTSDAYLRVIEDAGKTKVSWGFHGKHKVPFNIMMMFMNMDKAVGADFEQGLAKLKKVLEN